MTLKTQALNIICAGECMLELRSQEDKFISSYAGDVINFAVYLKRLLPTSSVQFLSAVGTDSSSENMRQFLAKEGIDTKLISSSPNKTIGLYMIETDANGERTFNYWRSDSAARRMMELTDYDALKAASQDSQYFFFSGISLAILHSESRDRLFDLVQDLRAAGKKIIFDPNYRATLWPSVDIARTEIGRAYNTADILLSSYEDEQLLFGTASKKKCIERLKQFSIDEVVMTDGAEETTAILNGKEYSQTPEKTNCVIDTTAAGDSFKAGYLAARHNGAMPDIAMAKASKLSAVVVGHAGAIIAPSLMP